MGSDFGRRCRRQSSLSLWRWSLLTLLYPLFGQELDYTITRINADKGLSESHGYSIIQDRRGFMWFGTRDGLNRYDGYQMKVYRNNPDDPNSLSNNYVYALMEDRQGILWIGTRGGINRFDPEQETFTRYQRQENNPFSLSHDTVRSIGEDETLSTRTIWVATVGAGLNGFDPTTGRFSHYRFEEHNPNSLASDSLEVVAARDGSVWVATMLGLCRMKVERPNHFTRYLEGELVTALHLGPKGDLWFASMSGLYHLDPRTENVAGKAKPNRIFPEFSRVFGSIWGIGLDSRQELWFGTSQEGIYALSPDRKTLRNWRHDSSDPDSLAHDYVSTLYVDQTGTPWVGSYGSGISQMTPTNFKREEGINEEVNSVLRDHSGTLWIGMANKGVASYAPDGTHLEHRVADATEDMINALFEDSQGNIWIGTENIGATKFERKTGRFTNYRKGGSGDLGGPGVYCFFEGPPGSLWIGTGETLSHMDLDQPGVFENYRSNAADEYALNNSDIACFSGHPTDTDKPLWIGTWNGGLNRMDLTKPGRFTHYKHHADDPISLSANAVLSIYEAPSGLLWVGTTGGFNRFDPTSGKAQNYFIRDGLPSNTIYHILPDGDARLWLSTPKGLSCFDPHSESFHNYDRYHGLVVEDFRPGCGFVERDGRFLFGGDGGLVSFYPQKIQIDSVPPKMVITGLELDNKRMRPKRFNPDSPLTKTIEATDHLKLSHTDSSLEMRFAALQFAAPEKHKYAYRLDGYDQAWIETGWKDRRASYMNLPPRTYTFRVKGSNKDGVWSEEAQLTIVVPTPPWRSPMAYVLYAFLVISLIMAYLYVQRRKLHYERSIVEHLQNLDRLKDEHNRDLELKVAERTEQLQARNQELVTMDRIVGVINREQDLQGVMEAILDEALALVSSADDGTVLLLNRKAEKMDIIAARGYDASELGEVTLSPDKLVERYTQNAQELRAGIYLANPAQIYPRDANNKLPISVSILAMALSLDDKLEGFLVLANNHKRNAFQDPDVNRLARFRDHAINAVAKARALRDLLDAQRELTAAAHEAGMAELASEMLHNMGNVLNSVRTSGSLIQEVAGKNQWQTLLQNFNDLFGAEHTAFPSSEGHRFKQLSELLAKGTTAVAHQQSTLLAETARLDEGLQRLLVMLNKQRRLTTARKAVVEVVDLNRIVEETLQSCLPKECNIRLVKELDRLPPISLEVNKLRRLVFFTMENALESIVRLGRGHHGLIRVVTSTKDGGVRLDVWDNGFGLSHMDPAKIYDQTEVTEWFGLHYCANAVKEMSGTIEIGATQGKNRLRLWLPLEQRQN